MFGRRNDDGVDDVEVIRSEEELRVDAEAVEMGKIRLRKSVEEERIHRLVPRGVEHADIEHHPPHADDSGEIETLDDGSISVPVLEEQLVVTKRVVVRERIVVRKRTVSEQHEIEAVLRRERVDLEGDASIADRVHLDRSAFDSTDPHDREGALPPPAAEHRSS